MKRFIKTETIDEAWYLAMPLKSRELYRLMWCRCDNAGVWIINWRIASEYVGEPVGPSDLSPMGGQIELLDNGKILLLGFVYTQCGKLSEKSKPHKYVLGLLEEHGLRHRVSEGYIKGIDTLKEKKQEQEKDSFLSTTNTNSARANEEVQTDSGEKEHPVFSNKLSHHYQGDPGEETQTAAVSPGSTPYLVEYSASELMMRNELTGQTQWRDLMTRGDWSVEWLLEKLTEFVTKMGQRQEKKKTYGEIKQHFVNWLWTQPQPPKKNNGKINPLDHL